MAVAVIDAVDEQPDLFFEPGLAARRADAAVWMPGTICSSSCRLVIPCLSNSSPVTAVATIGAWFRFSARNRAVTTTSSIDSEPAVSGCDCAVA